MTGGWQRAAPVGRLVRDGNVAKESNVGEYIVYAIIEQGGKQYKVEQGENICIEIRDLAQDQSAIEFDRVLYYQDDDATLVGQPYVAGAKVVGTVNGQAAGPKLFPMQFRRRKDSQRRIGHRQKYLDVQITEIVKPS